MTHPPKINPADRVQALSVDEIMAQVRSEVVRRGGTLPEPAVERVEALAVPVPPVSLARWQASAPRIPVKREYVLPEMLSLSDRDFVENAYRALLRRAPDDAGMRHFLDRLRDGRLSKVEVLAALRWSPEGEKEGVHVDGLLVPFLLQKWRRKRWIGPVVGWFQSLARLSRVSDRQSVLDAAQARETQELGRLVNLQAQQLEQRLALIESTLATHDVSRQLESERARSSGETFQLQLQQVQAELTTQALALADAQARFEEVSRLSARLDKLGDTGARLDQFGDVAARWQLFAEQVGVVSARLDSLGDVRPQSEAIGHRLDALVARVDAAPDVVPVIRLLSERLERVCEQEASLDRRVSDLDQALRPLLERDRQVQQKSSEIDPLLVAFEDAFRGGRQAVRCRVEPYLELIREAGAGTAQAPVLDLASGRGEWLELLKEQQLVARGVDSNRLFVEAGNGRGLQLTHGSAVDVLASQADASIGAVTVMRQADHPPLAELLEILDQSLRVLRPGGLLLLHGFNSENVVLAAPDAGKQGQPLPPEVMRWLVEARGFYSAHIARPAARDAAPVTVSAPRSLTMVSAAVVPFEASQLSSECAVVARKLS